MNYDVTENPAVPNEPGQSQEAEVVTQEIPTSINIEGLGDVSFDDIKSWKNGYMRQEDYTRKTQDLANQRKEFELERSQYQVPNQSNDTHNNSDIDPGFLSMQKDMSRMYLDMQMRDMKQKYGDDFDEYSVLKKANDLISKGTPESAIDWDFIHNGIMNSKRDKGVDIESLKEQIRQELINEQQQITQATSSVITSGASSPIADEISLSKMEDEIRAKMGFTKEEWLANR